MKTKNLLSTFAITVLAVAFSTSYLFSQDDPAKNQNQIKVKSTVKNEIKTQTQTKSQFKEHGNKFVDANGDGYNDNAPDADGDGIPNGRDEDYSGSKFRKGNNNTKGFVDLNGDGINDRAIDSDGDGIPNGKDADYVRPQDGSGQKFMNGKNYQNKFGGNKYGPGDGTGNNGVGPKDGSGYGSGSGTGTGNCDGTGPKGYTRGGRK